MAKFQNAYQKSGTHGLPYVPRKFAEAASEVLLLDVFSLVEFCGQCLQIGGKGEFAIVDGALDFGGFSQTHVKEFSDAFHQGGEWHFISGNGGDGSVHIEGRQQFFEIYRFRRPIQRGFDGGSRSDEEIRILQTLLVILLIKNDFVAGVPDCVRNETFFFLDSTLSKAIRRLSKVSVTSK